MLVLYLVFSGLRQDKHLFFAFIIPTQCASFLSFFFYLFVLEHFNETASLAKLLGSQVYDKPEMFQCKYTKPKYSLLSLLKKEGKVETTKESNNQK
jgi:hypothetical protein